jgi:glutathione synthase
MGRDGTRHLVVLDDPERLQPSGDTSVVLIEALRGRGHEVDVCHPRALLLVDGQPLADVRPVEATSRTSRPALTVGQERRSALSEYALVLMRKDPPFDMEYLFATLLLERARGVTRVINDPRGLREANEKLYAFEFAPFVPPTLVTRSMAELRRFLVAQGGEMVVKPLDGAGGLGVFHVRVEDRNTGSILETATALEQRLVVAQRYLPEAREGDKRILLVHGEPVGAVLRVPRDDEARGNLHVGGRPVRATLTARDKEICDALGPRLVADGLALVGIDVIGGWLTEVNVTSPTGVQEINRLEGIRLEELIVDRLLHSPVP